MSKGLSLGLVVAGIIVIVFGLVAHFVLKLAIFPHFNVVVGVIGLLLAAVGAWGLVSQRQSA